MDFHPDERQLATAHENGTIKIWRLRNAEEMVEMRGHDGWVEDIQFTPNGTGLVSAGGSHRGTSASDRHELKLWSIPAVPDTLTVSLAEGYWLAFSPNGESIAAGWGSGLGIRNATTGALIHTLREDIPPCTSVQWSSDGSRLVSCGYRGDNAVRIWEVSSGRKLLEMQAHEDEVTSVAFNATADRIASYGFDGLVRIWDAHTGAELLTLGEQAVDYQTVASSVEFRRQTTCYRIPRRKICDLGYGTNGFRHPFLSNDRDKSR